MHWATLRHHSDLFWTAPSTSSQVIPILNKSLLTALLQFVRGRPGPRLNPVASQCNACRGMRRWSIRITCPSQQSLLSLSMSSILCCPVLALTSSFVTLSFQEMPKMLLCHLWSAVFRYPVAITWVPGPVFNCHRSMENDSTHLGRLFSTYLFLFSYKVSTMCLWCQMKIMIVACTKCSLKQLLIIIHEYTVSVSFIALVSSVISA